MNKTLSSILYLYTHFVNKYFFHQFFQPTGKRFAYTKSYTHVYQTPSERRVNNRSDRIDKSTFHPDRQHRLRRKHVGSQLHTRHGTKDSSSDKLIMNDVKLRLNNGIILKAEQFISTIHSCDHEFRHVVFY